MNTLRENNILRVGQCIVLWSNRLTVKPRAICPTVFLLVLLQVIFPTAQQVVRYHCAICNRRCIFLTALQHVQWQHFEICDGCTMFLTVQQTDCMAQEPGVDV